MNTKKQPSKPRTSANKKAGEGCPVATCSPSDYDAGLLNDFGGGDVGWWQDYIRAEIGRANEYWREIYNTEADEVELKSIVLRELSKRNYQDAGTQAIEWNKLRDERDEARKIAAELRDLVPWSESEPWNFSWENAKGMAPGSAVPDSGYKTKLDR